MDWPIPSQRSAPTGLEEEHGTPEWLGDVREKTEVNTAEAESADEFLTLDVTTSEPTKQSQDQKENSTSREKVNDENSTNESSMNDENPINEENSTNDKNSTNEENLANEVNLIQSSDVNLASNIEEHPTSEENLINKEIPDHAEDSANEDDSSSIIKNKLIITTMSFSGFRNDNRSQPSMQTQRLSSTPVTHIPTAAAETPRYDRQINILVENTSITHLIPLEKRMIDMSRATTKPKSKFPGLPSKIRLLIYEQLMPPSKQVVSLDRQAVREKMAPENHFQVPDDILWCVWGLIESCKFMREDVMSYFWETFTFHATFSPMITKNLNFGSMSYLPRWGHKVQRLNIELDFTTLGGSANPDGHQLMFGKKKLQESFTNLIKQISGRGGHPAPNTIQYLHILCRRFAGYRPVGQDHFGRPLLYCPEAAMTIIHEDLIKIKDRILSLRLSGFTQNYTINTLKSVFPAAARVTPVLMETSAWPDVTPAIFLSAQGKQALYNQLLVSFGAVDTEATRAKTARAARRQAENEKALYFANAERIRREHKLAKQTAEEREVQKEKEEKGDGLWKQAAEQPEEELDHDVEVASDDKLDGNADDDQSASAYEGEGEGAGDDESVYNDDDYEDELVNTDDEDGEFTPDYEQTCADSGAVDGGGLGRTASGMKMVSLGLGGIGVRQLDGSVMTLEKHRTKRAIEKKDLERVTMLEQNVKNRMDPAFRVTARAMNLAHSPPTNFDEVEHNLSQEGKEEEEEGERKEKKGTAGRKMLAKMASHLRLRK